VNSDKIEIHSKFFYFISKLSSLQQFIMARTPNEKPKLFSLMLWKALINKKFNNNIHQNITASQRESLSEKIDKLSQLDKGTVSVKTLDKIYGNKSYGYDVRTLNMLALILEEKFRENDILELKYESWVDFEEKEVNKLSEIVLLEIEKYKSFDESSKDKEVKERFENIIEKIVQQLTLKKKYENEINIYPQRGIEKKYDEDSLMYYWQQLLGHILLDVVPKQMNEFDFTENGIKLKNYYKLEITENNELFINFKNSKKEGVLLEELDKIMTNFPSVKYLTKEDEKRLRDSGPIRIKFPPSFLGVAAVLFYIRDILNFDLELEYGPHALHIVHTLINDKYYSLPDAMILGNAPSSALYTEKNLKKYEYDLKYVLIPCQQKVIQPYYNLKDEIVDWSMIIPSRDYIKSTGGLSIDRTIALKNDKIKKAKIVFGEPCDARQYLQDDNGFRPIVWEPLITYLEMIKMGRPITFENSVEKFDSFFYVHQSKGLEISNLLTSLIVITIDKLRAYGKSEINKTIKKMLNDEEYVKSLLVFCGVPLGDLPAIKNALSELPQDQKDKIDKILKEE
jgi:hypothetical protein